MGDDDCPHFFYDFFDRSLQVQKAKKSISYIIRDLKVDAEWKQVVFGDKYLIRSAIKTPLPNTIEVKHNLVQEQCVICMDQQPNQITLPCKHVCCNKCIIENFEKTEEMSTQRLVCFQCRQPIQKVYRLPTNVLGNTDKEITQIIN